MKQALFAIPIFLGLNATHACAQIEPQHIEHCKKAGYLVGIMMKSRQAGIPIDELLGSEMINSESAVKKLMRVYEEPIYKTQYKKDDVIKKHREAATIACIKKLYKKQL